MEDLALVLVISATFCWGLAQVLGKLALREIGSFFFNTLRFSVAASIITAGAVLFGSFESLKMGLPLLSAVVSGASAWFVATFLLFYVLKRDEAHRIIPAGNSYPFWAILFSALLLNERITFLIPVSTVLVFGGTLLLSRRRSGGDGSWDFGVPVASFVGFVWGLNAVLNKFALEEGMSRSALLWVRITTAMMLYVVFFVIRRMGSPKNLTRRTLGLTVASGAIAFPMGSFLYVWALSMEKASVLAPITGATVLFGFILSVLILGERPTKGAFLGMLTIFFGIFLMAI